MKKPFLAALLTVALLGTACSSSNDSTPAPSPSSTAGDVKCGFHNGNQLWKGPQGGCYYINSSGNKEYVAKTECSSC
ncbi:hypothetical protein [Hymenobacter terricola]|uniref:hypothetical protein n=1 Tax=Hymenobacter terricola TaxID=2819236 RepID=UPI001B3035BF|nr:hypothetical protein [Hymenobacter terricola]